MAGSPSPEGNFKAFVISVLQIIISEDILGAVQDTFQNTYLEEELWRISGTYGAGAGDHRENHRERVGRIWDKGDVFDPSVVSILHTTYEG